MSLCLSVQKDKTYFSWIRIVSVVDPDPGQIE
jgi:hypothetical protein